MSSLPDIQIAGTLFEKRRVFLGSADPALQADLSSAATRLSREFKLLIMMGYQPVTAAPFVWQSPLTEIAVASIEPLLEARLLTLLGRPGVSSAADYLRERTSDTEKLGQVPLPGSEFASEIPTPLAHIVARRLDSLSALLPRHSSVEETFRRLVTKDLIDDSLSGSLAFQLVDVLPVRFSALARRTASRISIELTAFSGDHFSRAGIQSTLTAAGAPHSLVIASSKRSTGLYLAANAIASNSKLLVPAGVVATLPPGVLAVTELSLTPENPYLFLKVLAAFGIPPSAIDALPATQLRRLVTEASEFKAFSAWYSEFVNASAADSASRPDSEQSLTRLVRRIESQRTETVIAQARANVVSGLERRRFHWFVGALGALVSLKFGLGPSGFGVAKAGTKWTLDKLRSRFDRAITKPLAGFEAMIIREGLFRESEASETEHETAPGPPTLSTRCAG